MKTMKKFWIYFILFILLFLFVSGMTYLGTLRNKNNIRNVKCVSAMDNDFEVNIEKSQASNRKVHVKGNIVNNTGELVSDKYLQISFLDEHGALIGTQFEKINYFNAKEKIPFDYVVKANHVNEVVVSLVDESVKNEYEKNHSNILSAFKIDDNTFWAAFVTFLIFY